MRLPRLDYKDDETNLPSVYTGWDVMRGRIWGFLFGFAVGAGGILVAMTWFICGGASGTWPCLFV